MRAVFAHGIVLGFLAPALAAQAAAERQALARIDLGRALFEARELSDGGKVSCATCHVPAKSFVDGLADSKGRMDLGIGRNSPTLFAIGGVNLFRDPDQPRTAAPGKEPRALDLEQRCLAPLENELEMGASAKAAAAALKRVPGMDSRFDQAFGGGGGATVPRIGKALAAFVRSIAPPPSPYRRHREGDASALGPAEQRGLALFEGAARCAVCHGGAALSDGLMHVVDPPDGARIRDRERAAMQRRIELVRLAVEKDEKAGDIKLLAADPEHARKLPGGGGYDASQLEVQTTTLWDVARTGPWFRDGSEKDLAETLRRHLAEMAEVRARLPEVEAVLKTLARAGKRPPKALRAPSVSPPAIDPLPDAAFEDLLAFLRAL